MKSSFSIHFVVLLLLAGMNLDHSAFSQSLSFDRGGVSVDFLKADNERRKSGIAAKNVLFREDVKNIDAKTGLPPSWLRAFYVFSIHQEEVKKLTNLISPLSTQKVSTEGSKQFFTLQTDVKAQVLRAKHTQEASKVKPDFCGSLQRWITLPEPYKERKLRIRFKYRGVMPEGIEGMNVLLLQGQSMDRKESPWQGKSVGYKQERFSRFNNQWQEGEMTMLSTEQAKSVSISLKNYGCNKIDIDDIVVEEIAKGDEGLSVYLTPQFFADNLYCLAAGEPSILKLAYQNEAGVKLENPVAVLELPEGIEIVDVRTPMKLRGKVEVLREGERYVQYKYELASLKQYIKREELNHYTSSYFLLKSSFAAGDTLYPAKYWVEDGAYFSTPKPFDFKIIESVESTRPVKFETGAIVTRELDFQSSDNLQTLVDFYAGKGFNTVHIENAPRELMAKFLIKGIKRYTQPTAWLANGYRIGMGTKPNDVRFQLIDGTYHDRGICPVAVYQPGDYFRQQVEAPLRKLLVEDRLSDGIMPNWEPYMYDFKGCFCPRCKIEFGKYAKLTAAQIDRDWPNEIITKHRPVWIKFRAWQHGQLMRALEKTIHRIGKEAGLDSHFIPEIATLSLTPEGRNEYEHVDPLQYIDGLKVIEPWGPYIGVYTYPGRYTYYTGAHVTMDAKAREVKEYISRHIPNPEKRPELIGFPHASQGTYGMAEPEGIAFDSLCLFVNGWKGALAYMFPDGFDARYWNAMATANRAISRFEKHVMNGIPIAAHDLEVLTPMPKFSLSPSAKAYQMDPGTPLIFSHEFGLDGQRLLVIGNAWKYGDAFVRLSLDKISSGKKFVLREPLSGRCYANGKGETGLSATDLKEGMVLHVGALRFAFFLLEPYQVDMDYGRVIKPSDMNEALTNYRPKILEKLDFETRYQDQGVQ